MAAAEEEAFDLLAAEEAHAATSLVQAPWKAVGASVVQKKCHDRPMWSNVALYSRFLALTGLLRIVFPRSLICCVFVRGQMVASLLLQASDGDPHTHYPPPWAAPEYIVVNMDFVISEQSLNG